MSSLAGKHILITREKEAARRFSGKIRKLGGQPIEIPFLQTICRHRGPKIDLQVYEWVFFTSQKGVECFLHHTDYAHHLHKCRIAVVGEKTAQLIEAYGYKVDFMPSIYHAETMAREFLHTFKTHKPVLLVRGSVASPVLPKAFQREGQPYDCLEVYETRRNLGVKALLERTVREKHLDYITFTSPFAVDTWMSFLEEEANYYSIPVVCIGWTTAERVRQYPFKTVLVPEKFTIDHMIEVMVEDSKKKGK